MKSAAQAAVESAQAVAEGAIRIPAASAQIAAQMPDLVENLAVATERLNTTIDRMERYMAVADPMFQTLDRLLPQLEALIAMGDDVFRALSGIPGIGTLSRLTGLSSDERDHTTAAARSDAGEAKTKSSKPSARPSRRR